MTEFRYCSNCRAELPEKATSCPTCGVFAGDLFDERQRRRPSGSLIAILAVLLILAGALFAWLRLERQPAARPAATATTPPRVVGDRPGITRRGSGAAITEAEAILTLRRHLVAELSISSNCIAILSNGYKDGHYTFTAVNHCENTRLGKFRVNGRTRAVVRGAGLRPAGSQPSRLR